jgi:hypothetical protein
MRSAKNAISYGIAFGKHLLYTWLNWRHVNLYAVIVCMSFSWHVGVGQLPVVKGFIAWVWIDTACIAG